MPLYEFICTHCGQPFEELVRSATAINEVTCPICGSTQVTKKVSTFASKISGGGRFPTSLSSSACDSGGT